MKVEFRKFNKSASAVGVDEWTADKDELRDFTAVTRQAVRIGVRSNTLERSQKSMICSKLTYEITYDYLNGSKCRTKFEMHSEHVVI